jgi:hypothetical protein
MPGLACHLFLGFPRILQRKEGLGIQTFMPNPCCRFTGVCPPAAKLAHPAGRAPPAGAASTQAPTQSSGAGTWCRYLAARRTTKGGPTGGWRLRCSPLGRRKAIRPWSARPTAGSLGAESERRPGWPLQAFTLGLGVQRLHVICGALWDAWPVVAAREGLPWVFLVCPALCGSGLWEWFWAAGLQTSICGASGAKSSLDSGLLQAR